MPVTSSTEIPGYHAHLEEWDEKPCKVNSINLTSDQHLISPCSNTVIRPHHNM